MRWRPCQTASWHAHIHTNKDKPAHTSTSSSPHTHTLAHSSVCVFDLARISIVNPCEKSTCASLAQATHVSSSPTGQLHRCHCHQLGNELLEFPSSLPFICIKAARTCTSASYHLALPLSNSQYLIRQRVSLFNYTSNIQFQFKSHQIRLLKLNWFRTPKKITSLKIIYIYSSIKFELRFIY